MNLVAKKLTLSLWVLGAFAGLSQVSIAALKEGDKIPAFSAKGNDGKNYAIQQLIKKGPVFLQIFDKECPFTAKYLPFFKQVISAYGAAKKYSYLGVIDADLKGYQAWNKKFQTKFVSLLDPKTAIIQKLSAERTPWLILVGKNGKVQKIWKGYSQSILDSISTELAKASGVKKKALSFKGAPTIARSGCLFEWVSR